MKLQKAAALVAGAAVLCSYAPSVWAAPNQPAPKVKTYPTAINLSGKKLMTVNHAVAVDPSSGRPTSWIPAMTVESILRQLGMDAHFVPGVNQLVLDMPLGYTVSQSLQIPYHYKVSQPGRFVIFANAKALANPPALGNGPNVDLPVYYVMKALKELGVSSHWNGSTWEIDNKVKVPSLSRMPGDVSQTFALKLSNKLANGSATTDLPTPPVPPVSPVTVNLPMNTLLSQSSQPLSNASEDLPMQDYVQTGKATYTVNQPIAAVEAWFEAAYEAQGFASSGSGAAADLRTGRYVENETFTPTKQAARQDENVTMSYESLGANQTKVEYWVYDTVVPQRPSSSLIPSGATSLDVQISTTGSQGGATGVASGSGQASGTASAGSSVTSSGTSTAGTGQSSSSAGTSSSSASGTNATQTVTKTVTNSQAIATVVSAVNALNAIDPPGISAGGPMINQVSTATLTFHFASGQTVTVKAVKVDSGYGDVTVDNIPLKDPNGTVWAAIQQAIQ